MADPTRKTKQQLATSILAKIKEFYLTFQTLYNHLETQNTQEVLADPNAPPSVSSYGYDAALTLNRNLQSIDALIQYYSNHITTIDHESWEEDVTNELTSLMTILDDVNDTLVVAEQYFYDTNARSLNFHKNGQRNLQIYGVKPSFYQPLAWIQSLKIWVNVLQLLLYEWSLAPDSPMDRIELGNTINQTKNSYVPLNYRILEHVSSIIKNTC